MQTVGVNYSYAHEYTSFLRTTPAAREGFGGRGDEGAKQNAGATLLVPGDINKGCQMAGGCRGQGGGDRTRVWDGEGHQLCLPAGPNTLGFFATEDLKVHPTRSPRPKGQPATQTNEHTKENDKKKRRRSRVVKS